MHVCVRAKLCLTLAHQAPLSVGFSKQEYLSWLPCPPLGDLPNPGIKSTSLMSPALACSFFTTSAAWEAHTKCTQEYFSVFKISLFTLWQQYLGLADIEKIILSIQKRHFRPSYLLVKITHQKIISCASTPGEYNAVSCWPFTKNTTVDLVLERPSEGIHLDLSFNEWDPRPLDGAVQLVRKWPMISASLYYTMMCYSGHWWWMSSLIIQLNFECILKIISNE